MDRTSQRENIQRHEHKVHSHKKQDHERVEVKIPENLTLDDIKVLIGYYRRYNKNFIERVGYPVKINTRGASVKIERDLLQATYLLLHNEEHDVQLYKLKPSGHNICTMSDLKEQGYVSESEKENGNVYMMFRIDSEGTEKEWGEFTWDYNKVILPIRKSKGKVKPVVYPLTTVIGFNNKV